MLWNIYIWFWMPALNQMRKNHKLIYDIPYMPKIYINKCVTLKYLLQVSNYSWNIAIVPLKEICLSVKIMRFIVIINTKYHAI